MKYFYCSILFLLLSEIGYAQFFDQNWPIGILEYPGNPLYGNAMIHFGADGAIIIEKRNLGMNFERTVGVISDSTGQLLFYTNGCYIANSLGDTMQNGTGINPGLVHDWVCPQNGYVVQQGAMILPLPGHRDSFYLFHLGAQYDPNNGYSYGPLYYTIIDRSLDDGNGAVVDKNIVITSELPESFTVIRHGNGRDWWLITPEYSTDRYRIYLLSPQGLSLSSTVQTGPNGNCSRIGSLIASPDGSRIARVQNCRTIVLDFDRCSGTLSYKISFERPNYVFAGGGAAFSADARYLAIVEQVAILSTDLEASNPVLDTLVPLDSVIGRNIQTMLRAPNGFWYLNQPHRGRFLPELRSLSDQSPGFFSKKGIQLPVYNVRSLPYFPNYRLYDKENSPCDTLGINTPLVSVGFILSKEDTVACFPNPVKDLLRLNLNLSDDSDQLRFRLHDIYGRKVLDQSVHNGENIIYMNDLPNQIYFPSLLVRGSAHSIGKLIKE